MNPRIVSVALAAVLSVAAVPAFAGDHAGAGKEHVSFPMKADAFQQRVEARLTKMKARMEKRIVEKKLDAAKAKEVRDRFDARAAKVRAATAEAAKDGVVTQDEAKAIRAAGGRHKHHGKK